MWQHIIEQAEREFGAVTILVDNAGILGPIAATTEFTEEDYLQVCAVNQHSQFYGMKTVIPSMQKAGGGSIVNISSTAGMVSIVGAPNLAYVGSKFASRGMTKHVAVQYGPDNIRGQLGSSRLHQNADDGRGHRLDRWWYHRSGSAAPDARSRGSARPRTVLGLR